MLAVGTGMRPYRLLGSSNTQSRYRIEKTARTISIISRMVSYTANIGETSIATRFGNYGCAESNDARTKNAAPTVNMETDRPGPGRET